METWKIVLISIAVVVVVIGIILAIVIPIVLKKKKNKATQQPSVAKSETIQLKAVKLEQGSGLFGYETKEELKERLSKLSKEEFKALEIDDYPFNVEQWNSLEGQPEAIKERNAYEMGIYFAYNYKRELKEDADILKRTF